ncbi:magnesium chelatase subunit D family protein [Candidatus Poribacteria bacterium]|nr:magnesium chelatase subunit D family protein [Candidatus Poribacteria bacterium]
MRSVLPFTAIVGQERLKKALILNAVNPNLRGVLIKGERGTAKSTAVRALADLLPDIEVVADCPFNCHPTDRSMQCGLCAERAEAGEELPVIRRKMRVVDLPLGATEDRIAGTLDIEKALKEGIKALQPGLLAEANRGILYIDEINLLEDHLVDVLLDAAAMGVNVVEREGISVSHPARFILVGTMNPEEGELRPQLLDRIGLSVEVRGSREIEERKRIIEVVEEFESDPVEFARRWEPRQRKLRDRIVKAKEMLPQVRISDEMLGKIAKMCVELEVDGHRADILIARCARTIAAYDLREEVSEGDIREAASFVLPHRLKTDPFEEPPDIEEILDQVMNDEPEERENEEEDEDDKEDKGGGGGGNGGERRFDIGRALKPQINPKRDRKLRVGHGRRAKSISTGSGKYVKPRMPRRSESDIALDATLRAAALRSSGNGFRVEREDLRVKVRERRVSAAIAFVVDASGSMGVQRRMEVAKGVVMELLRESYQKRDKVAFVAFRDEGAQLVMPFTSSLTLAAKKLMEVPTGGKTPLAAGIKRGLEVLRSEINRNPHEYPIMMLVSDGRANVPIKEKIGAEIRGLAERIRKEGIHLVIIDGEDGFLKVGYNDLIEEIAGGERYKLDELRSKNFRSYYR